MAKLTGKKAKIAVAVGMAACGVTGGWLYFAVPRVAEYEGFYTHTYQDIVGVPTYCLGETEDAQMGRTYAVEFCVKLLIEKLPRYNDEITRCLRGIDLSDKMRASFVSLAYNIGSAGFCRSTVVRRLRAGDKVGACEAIRLFNRAGGRVVQGLVNRRADEHKLCMEGL